MQRYRRSFEAARVAPRARCCENARDAEHWDDATALVVSDLTAVGCHWSIAAYVAQRLAEEEIEWIRAGGNKPAQAIR